MNLIDQKSNSIGLQNASFEMSEEEEETIAMLRDFRLRQLMLDGCRESRTLLKMVESMREKTSPRLLSELSQFFRLKQEVFQLKDEYLRDLKSRVPPLSYFADGFHSDGEDDLPSEATRFEGYMPDHEGRQAKIELLLLEEQLQEMEKRITGHFNGLNKSKPCSGSHVCKICLCAFRSGRQLGGHVSRKHPSEFEVSSDKKEVHRLKGMQRSRRKFLRDS